MTSGPSPEEVFMARLVEEWMTFPTWTSAQLKQRGVKLDTPNLLHFTDPEGVERYFAFQFDHNTKPHAVVLEINASKGYANDPVGVIDWWLHGTGIDREQPAPIMMLRDWIRDPDAGIKFARYDN